MASATMRTVRPRAANPAVARFCSVSVVRAAASKGPRASRRQGAGKVMAAVQYEYPTKVFPRELVKFADTEEYIYK